MRPMARPPLALALCVVGCGASEGPRPGTTYFWHLTQSTVEFGGACSDAQDFRESTPPIALTANTYLVYRVSDDGHEAVAQTCDRRDSATCRDSEEGFRWSVSGLELSMSRSLTEPVGSSSCTLVQSQQWTMTHRFEALTAKIASLLSLAPTSPACDAVETDLKARSPNQLGVTGCEVVFVLSGTL